MGFLKAAGRDILLDGKPILLRGVGLGGWLLPEGYMWKLYDACDRPRRMEALIKELCGSAYAEQFWRNYFDRYISSWDLALIKKEGFNSVRLPINARHLHKEETLSRIDNLISLCRELGLLVILDMHGAPGGQTGTNIDDSANDRPELFEKEAYQQELIDLWRMLARRYKDETAVAGYDLMNEPLPEWFGSFNPMVLPLYRRLVQAIREEDTNHMIIVEGTHWATDFSIFDPLQNTSLDDNCMLQFHKYWSNPDKESIMPFLQYRERLNMPLFMGEGGENNLAWYTAAFPLYERENISWSFWSYKKMDCKNSPVTFLEPAGWKDLIRHLKGEMSLTAQQAEQIFESFLNSIASPKINQEVFRALKREAPLSIPAEHFDACSAVSKRLSGAEYRLGESLTILFENGKTGKPNYQRYGGEDQPEEENLVLRLLPGDRAAYWFVMKEDSSITITARGPGRIGLCAGHWQESIDVSAQWGSYSLICETIGTGGMELWVTGLSGEVLLDTIQIG